MKRFVQTSNGSALVEYRDAPGESLALVVTPFDEVGWEGRGKRWTEKQGYHSPTETLSEFLALTLGISNKEADALADEMRGSWQDEWEERGGVDDQRQAVRWIGVFIVAGAVLAGLALTGIALVVWLLAT